MNNPNMDEIEPLGSASGVQPIINEQSDFIPYQSMPADTQTARGFVYDDLFRMRVNYPHVPILEFPNVARTLRLTTHAVLYELEFPDGAQLAKFAVSTGSVLIWNRAIKTDLSDIAANAGRGGTNTIRNADSPFLVVGQSDWFYVQGMKGVSVMSPDTDAIILSALIILAGSSSAGG